MYKSGNGLSFMETFGKTMVRQLETHGHICIPGSFDWPSRNIAEKISSGYKAKEWQGYFFGLTPALLYGVLPMEFWKSSVNLYMARRDVCLAAGCTNHVQYAKMLISIGMLY
jgi:hypothetical protein